MPTLPALEEHLAGLGRVVLGYSGGVDSTLLAVAGRRALGFEGMLAVIGRSASYPAAQRQAAVALANQFDVPVLELETYELDDPQYVANTPDRCYFCKTELWNRLREIASARGFDVVIDGTNADDLGHHRPGVRAALEHSVGSPLAELGWRKADVRAAAQELGLPIWDAPASPCLSSRIRYGLAVTPARLGQVEAAEAHLRRLGIDGDLRVRHLGAAASIEVGAEHHARLRDSWDALQAFFVSLGFNTVELDPRGYRRGSLLAIAGESIR